MSARRQARAPSLFLDLPDEVLSHIASYLPAEDVLPFLALHPILLGLTKSHHSPLPGVVRALLDAGPPYPALLAVLPTLRLFLPNDSGHMFIDVLVRARPKWILERLEHGRWKDSLWQEAFERRFLPSWKGYKREGDSWRAVFLRVLGRLEHRNLGCTQEESWTRWVTLHRNGASSINRYYSRTFDPFEIYNELKHQNNFAAEPTQVRVILHLQDIRIIALGVLLVKPSLFVNPNAHILLHPPLLRNLESRSWDGAPAAASAERSSTIPIRKPTAGISPSANSNEAYYPLARSLSPSSPTNTSYGLTEGPMPSSSLGVLDGAASFRSSISRVMPRVRRSGSSSTDYNPLTLVRSRDSDTEDGQGRRRSWVFGRARSASATGQIMLRPDVQQHSVPSPSIRAHEPLTPAMPTLQEFAPERFEPQPSTSLIPPTPPKTPPLIPSHRLPYPSLRKPQPAQAFSCYPNYTPYEGGTTRPAKDLDPEAEEGNMVPRIVDRRALHPEVEDEYDGMPWSPSTSNWGESTKMAEWDEDERVRKRWVGPMILVAQLHPSDRQEARPLGANASTPIEGAHVDLGPQGMYVSMGFEDLEMIMGWIELKGGGPHGAPAMRNGLGFE